MWHLGKGSFIYFTAFILESIQSIKMLKQYNITDKSDAKQKNQNICLQIYFVVCNLGAAVVQR